MASQFGMNNCGGKGSDEVGATSVMSALTSKMALELKPSPKQTCIPEHQRERMVSSQIR